MSEIDNERDRNINNDRYRQITILQIIYPKNVLKISYIFIDSFPNSRLL